MGAYINGVWCSVWPDDPEPTPVGPCRYANTKVPHGPHDVWPLVAEPGQDRVLHVGLGSVPCAGYRAPMTQNPEPTETVDVPVELPAKEETTIEVPTEESKAPEPFGYETKENPRA